MRCSSVLPRARSFCIHRGDGRRTPSSPQSSPRRRRVGHDDAVRPREDRQPRLVAVAVVGGGGTTDADAGGSPARLLLLRRCLPVLRTVRRPRGGRARRRRRRRRRRPVRRRVRRPGGAGEGRAEDMGGRPARPPSARADGDTDRPVGVPPLPCGRGRAEAAGGTTDRPRTQCCFWTGCSRTCPGRVVVAGVPCPRGLRRAAAVDPIDADVVAPPPPPPPPPATTGAPTATP